MTISSFLRAWSALRNVENGRWHGGAPGGAAPNVIGRARLSQSCARWTDRKVRLKASRKRLAPPAAPSRRCICAGDRLLCKAPAHPCAARANMRGHQSIQLPETWIGSRDADRLETLERMLISESRISPPAAASGHWRRQDSSPCGVLLCDDAHHRGDDDAGRRERDPSQKRRQSVAFSRRLAIGGAAAAGVAVAAGRRRACCDRFRSVEHHLQHSPPDRLDLESGLRLHQRRVALLPAGRGDRDPGLADLAAVLDAAQAIGTATDWRVNDRRHARTCSGHPRLHRIKIQQGCGWPGHRRAKRCRPSDGYARPWQVENSLLVGKRSLHSGQGSAVIVAASAPTISERLSRPVRRSVDTRSALMSSTSPSPL